MESSQKDRDKNTCIEQTREGREQLQSGEKVINDKVK